ncbi:hypothetical protein [Actinomadura sp. WMMA1423]|uniref:hypothetical protein n=1 Tax=Actinomadura sp. WMMA1423 TaxID=2591108 RepID=UPI00114632C2|nr:hypothetical protein [Actinomadura sp. WMMA1423]
MTRSVLRIDTKIVFRFGYSLRLNETLKAASGHRVRWDRGLRAFTLPVSDLAHDPRLRASIHGFITGNGFEAEAAVLFLLRAAPRPSWIGPWETASGFRPEVSQEAERFGASGPVDRNRRSAPRDGSGGPCEDCAAWRGTTDDGHARQAAASGGDGQGRRLDRWESALRRMLGVIDALDTLLRRMWRMPAVYYVLLLIALLVFARFPELRNAIIAP